MYHFDGKYLSEIDKLEKEVERYLISNWNRLFPFLKLIKAQYKLPDKAARISRKTSGIIDILAYNSHLKRFVVVEIKTSQEDDKVIGQATDYAESITNNFDSIYLDVLSNGYLEIPNRDSIDKTVDVIIIVKGVDQDLIQKKFKVLKNPPIYISYKFLKNHNSNQELFVFDLYTHESEFSHYIESSLSEFDLERTSSKRQSKSRKEEGIPKSEDWKFAAELKSKSKEVNSNPKSKNIDSTQFPQIEFPDAKSRFNPNKKFKGYTVVYNIRRKTHLFEYFKNVIGLELQEIYKLKYSEFIEYEDLGFVIYRAATASYYIFAKSNLITSNNSKLNQRFTKFKKSFSNYD